jgi:hypothetical protein
LDKIEPASHRPQEGLQMRDQYMGLLLLVLTQAGLLDAITSMLEESASGTSLSRKAVLLMGEVMQLSNRLLPLHVAAQIQVCIIFTAFCSSGHNNCSTGCWTYLRAGLRSVICAASYRRH